MVTLISCLIWQLISFILPLNEYDCVYACTTLGDIATLLWKSWTLVWRNTKSNWFRSWSQLTIQCVFASLSWPKIHLFRCSSFWSWWVCKQAKLTHLGHRKPARIHWKAYTPKTSHCWCGFWYRGIIGQFFFENEQGVAVTVNRYRTMLNEFLFTKIEEEDIGNIWLQQDGATCHAAEATLDVLLPVFKDRIISRRADVVCLPRSCDLTPLDYYLWGALNDKCFADKP